MRDANPAPMSDAGDLDDLVAYVARSSGLDPSQARRIVDDVLSYLAESPSDFVRRWASSPPYSIRQIRRIIYG